MKKYGIMGWVIMLAFISACSPKMDIVQKMKQGQQSFNNENYEQSLADYKALLKHFESRGDDVPGELYLGLGKAHFELGNTDEAIAMLDQARYSEYNDPEIYEYLARSYRRIDNLSKEIISLEAFNQQFPDNERINEMRAWLFDTYVESENWQLAHELWSLLNDSTRKEEGKLNGYFLVSKGLENHKEALELARDIIKKDDDRKDVLEYLARYYYNTANDLYKAEMQAYEQNKTHTQYARLLKALEDVNANFKVSLKYFKKLYSMDPLPAYAQYLANIYARFDDKERAAYYREKAGK